MKYHKHIPEDCIRRAGFLLLEEARSIQESHAPKGDWTGEDDAHAAAIEMRDLAVMLLSLEGWVSVPHNLCYPVKANIEAAMRDRVVSAEQIWFWAIAGRPMARPAKISGLMI